MDRAGAGALSAGKAGDGGRGRLAELRRSEGPPADGFPCRSEAACPRPERFQSCKTRRGATAPGDNQLARHYPTRAFFRQMPNDLLARYFRRRGLFEDVDFAGLGETRPEALFAAWLALADQDRNAMEADFWEVFESAARRASGPSWT